MERFPEIPLERMTPAQRRTHDAILSGPRGVVRGPFATLLHSPALGQHVQLLGEYLRFHSKVPNDLRELCVLVTARRWTAQYEWYQHVKHALKFGIPQSVIDAIGAGRAPEGLTSDQQLVYDFAREVHRDGTPSDATFAALRERFGLEVVLDFVGLAGYYSLLAMVINTAQLAVPEGPPPLKAL